MCTPRAATLLGCTPAHTGRVSASRGAQMSSPPLPTAHKNALAPRRNETETQTGGSGGGCDVTAVVVALTRAASLSGTVAEWWALCPHRYHRRNRQEPCRACGEPLLISSVTHLCEFFDSDCYTDQLYYSDQWFFTEIEYLWLFRIIRKATWTRCWRRAISTWGLNTSRRYRRR